MYCQNKPVPVQDFIHYLEYDRYSTAPDTAVLYDQAWGVSMIALDPMHLLLEVIGVIICHIMINGKMFILYSTICCQTQYKGISKYKSSEE